MVIKNMSKNVPSILKLCEKPNVRFVMSIWAVQAIWWFIWRLVIEWVVKSHKLLFTFADIPHRCWSNMQKNMILLKLLTLLIKVMIKMIGVRMDRYLRILFSDPNPKFLTHRPQASSMASKMTTKDHSF